MNTWTTTRTGLTFHSFSSDGKALCRTSIKAAGELITEAQVDARLAEARGARVRGMKKCDTCAAKEEAFRDRLEASTMPSTGEGDYLPPAKEETIEAPAMELTWVKKDTWGPIGLSHYTQVTIDGIEYAFCVDQPSKGFWVARGWRDGRFCMYREAKTLAGAKQIVAMRVGEMKGASQ